MSTPYVHIHVHMKNGKVCTGARVTAEELAGWEHMLTTTIQGERLEDVGVAILCHSFGKDYIVVSEIMSVSITTERPQQAYGRLTS